jgi:excisionase family DNA binding protein
MKKPATKMVTMQQAAERLGISLRTVKRMTAAGGLKSVKIGRLRRIPEAEVQKIETARRVRVIY